jgi:Anion-transporting ATPase
MGEIELSLSEFIRSKPGLKYTFFGGKGGVGKTVMAGAAALHLADLGKRTILASTNPVHSLSGLLDQNVYGKPTPVTGVNNLWAYEIDTKETIERSKADIKQKIQWFLKFAEISTQADAFVESATMNPAFAHGKCPPTAGHERRLFALGEQDVEIPRRGAFAERAAFLHQEKRSRPADGIPAFLPGSD